MNPTPHDQRNNFLIFCIFLRSIGKKIQDYWGPGKKLLSTPKFLDSLKTYDKDNIKVSIIKKIRKKYIGKENFTPEKAANASKAAAGLCKWVLAMEAYDRVAKVVSRHGSIWHRFCGTV